ncbi:MAG: efflux RND transporter periplasmic adaptor subunit [Planctomycetes bacterium]|nr:efflux RND transporter periplasmic adaptor subunit [Planctomycetota bacterium]
MRRISPIIIIFLSAAACRREAALPPAPPPPLVSAAVSETADVPVKITEIGVAAARERVEVRPQVAGRIINIEFQDGADVDAGAVLFKIDAAPYEADLAKAEADLQQNEAWLADAAREYERVKNLGDKGAISKQDVDTKKSRVAVQEAAAASSRAMVANAKINLDWCVIRAPFAGRLGRRLVDKGNVVRPDSAPALAVLESVDPIYIEFHVTEDQLQDVRARQGGGALRVEAVEPPNSNIINGGHINTPPAVGTLTFLDSEIGRETGNILLRATVPNPTRRFWPGQFVHVHLILEITKNAVLVPARAVQLSAAGPFVYVIKNDGAAELRIVKTGAREGDRVVIREGLAANEKVITDGHILVVPGSPVREKQGDAR